MIKNIFIDLDDTLIPNHYTYHVPQLDATRMICIDLEEFAPPPVQIIELATHYQVENIKELGYISKVCFPASFLRVYKELCAKAGREPNHKIEGAIVASATTYILQQYKLFPGVKETLEAITQRKIMVTRGMQDFQEYKVDNVSLRYFFEAIEAVPQKNKETYENLIKKYNLVPEETLMIGDSFRNDIKPALEAGLKAIHIDSGIINWDWEHSLEEEYHKDYDFPVIKSFSEIVNYLG